MLRGMPTTMSSTSFSRRISLRRARRSANGSAGIYSRGCAIIFSSSLTAMPMRLVPWSIAKILMAQSGLKRFEDLARDSGGVLDISLRVSRGKKARLKLGGRQVDAAFQHAVE